MKLYIIGNGFYRHHKLKTGYLDYRRYLDAHYHDVLSEFEDFPYLSMYGSKINDLWSDLEEALTIDYMECIDSAVRDDNYPDLNNESDARWYEIEGELDIQTRFIYKFTGEYLYEWLSSIDFTKCIPDLQLETNALYVTFNYTDTLERIYKIPSEQILHIHGRLVNVNPNNFLSDTFYIPAFSIQEAEVTEPIPLYPLNNDNVHKEIQFGSTNNDSEKIKKALEHQYGNDDFYGASIELGVNKIVGYCDASSKNLKQNYPVLNNFISNQHVDEIIIMGHSYEGIDSDYYKDILIPRFRNCLWTIYIHPPGDIEKVNTFISRYNLQNINLIEW